MKIEKGMATNIGIAGQVVRESVVKKLQSLGLGVVDNGVFYVGVDVSDGAVNNYRQLKQRIDKAKPTTLPELMFCDQPDNVTHCYYYHGELYYFTYGGMDEDYLVCTREPAVKPVG